MKQTEAAGESKGHHRLSDTYDDMMPEVYRYLRARCGSREVAEELTSATFVQAALEISNGQQQHISIQWLITVARNKLIDHWRRLAVADRSLTLIEGGRIESVDPWDAVLDQARSHDVLDNIAPHYRSVLMLRYLDDLSVPQCAEVLERTIHSTESLLVRARKAFRTEYEMTGGTHE